MIRPARNVLSVLLEKQGGRIDTSNLRTLMYEVAVNSCPLGMVNEDGKPLTPNVLLTMESDVLMSPQPDNFCDADIYSRNRWRTVQHLANVSWQRWETEYLSQLNTRQKWVKNQLGFRVGDIVLVKNKNCG